MFRIFAIALLTLGLSGCELFYTPRQHLAPARYMAIMDPPPLPQNTACVTTKETDPFMPRPDFTYATLTGAHGVQIEYFSSDGRVFLWYPGNRGVVTGLYRVIGHAVPGGTPRPDQIRFMEFNYQANSYNPVTGEAGGKWELARLSELRERTVSYAKGDIFDLSSGAVPYRRDKYDMPAPMKHRDDGTC